MDPTLSDRILSIPNKRKNSLLVIIVFMVTRVEFKRSLTAKLFIQNATAKLPVDREVTRADAERVTVAEMRNDPEMATRPGVAASVVEAARRNQKRK